MKTINIKDLLAVDVVRGKQAPNSRCRMSMRTLPNHPNEVQLSRRLRDLANLTAARRLSEEATRSVAEAKTNRGFGCCYLGSRCRYVGCDCCKLGIECPNAMSRRRLAGSERH